MYVFDPIQSLIACVSSGFFDKTILWLTSIREEGLEDQYELACEHQHSCIVSPSYFLQSLLGLKGPAIFCHQFSQFMSSCHVCMEEPDHTPHAVCFSTWRIGYIYIYMCKLVFPSRKQNYKDTGWDRQVLQIVSFTLATILSVGISICRFRGISKDCRDAVNNVLRQLDVQLVELAV